MPTANQSSLSRASLLSPAMRLMLLVAMVASLLAGTTAGAADGGPTDRKTALAMIEQAEAEAQAGTLEALRADLTPLEREWGMKLLGVRATAAGYAMSFRFTVLDSARAAPLLNRSVSLNPFVLVEKSGAKLGVPFTQKAGSLRSSVTTTEQIKEGRNYTVLFANPGQHVKPGDAVTIVIGDFLAEHITVQ